MEIVFQNRRQDLESFYTYRIKETEQGKRLSRGLLWGWLIRAVLISLLLGSLTWGITSKLRVGISVTVLILLVFGAMTVLLTGFEPLFAPAFEFFKKQEKSLNPRDWEVLQLPRTMTIDEQWLEIRSSEALHRWRWRQVDRIGLTSNFIFVHIGTDFVIIVPKRDFPSEQSFVEFGNKLVELKEKNKDQPIGAE